MAKKSAKSRELKRGASKKKAGAGRKAAAPARGAKRKTAGARTAKGKAARKRAATPSRPAKRSAASKAARSKAPAATGRRSTTARRVARQARAGSTGREEKLAQTPEAGSTRRGSTSPLRTKRSTGTSAGTARTHPPRLERERKILREIEEGVPTPPSSLDLDRGPSAARSGRQKLQDSQQDHNETSPVMTGGDVDADWEDAYSVGDEAPGGDNPTPDQDRVDDIGKALGVVYDDNEELKASDKITERDKHRWELDPASSEDYRDRD
jgi:Family of unknown function (DUF6335)